MDAERGKENWGLRAQLFVKGATTFITVGLDARKSCHVNRCGGKSRVGEGKRGEEGGRLMITSVAQEKIYRSFFFFFFVFFPRLTPDLYFHFL